VAHGDPCVLADLGDHGARLDRNVIERSAPARRQADTTAPEPNAQSARTRIDRLPRPPGWPIAWVTEEAAARTDAAFAARPDAVSDRGTAAGRRGRYRTGRHPEIVISPARTGESNLVATAVCLDMGRCTNTSPDVSAG
jgi:hypothetical protein